MQPSPSRRNNNRGVRHTSAVRIERALTQLKRLKPLVGGWVVGGCLSSASPESLELESESDCRCASGAAGLRGPRLITLINYNMLI